MPSPVSHTVEIAAPPARVWRALCDPIEVCQWDGALLSAMDAPEDYPQPGQLVHWHCRAGRFRILTDRVQEVVAESTLHSLLDLGPYRYDETYTLAPSGDGTRLRCEMLLSTALPVIGGLVTLVHLRRTTAAGLALTLEELKRHCEA